MDDALVAQLHDEAGNSPEAWSSSAADLLMAAGVLRNFREGFTDDRGTAPHAWRVHPCELMLRGMAIECLLKALWVKRGHRLVEGGQYRKVPGASPHDLVQLARALELTLSEFEKDLLRRLSHFVEYGGRYPVPKSAGKLQLVDSPSGGRAAATTWATPSDQVLFESVVNRIERLLAGRSA